MKYIVALIALMNEFKLWIYMLIGICSVIVMLVFYLKWLHGTADEKTNAIKGIRNTLIGAGAIYFLVWLVSEITTRFSTI